MNPKLLLCLALLSLNIQSVFAASGMFPKMPPAANVYVVDCRRDSTESKMTAWALQGLINQSSAEVYVISDDGDWEQLTFSKKPYIVLKGLPGADSGLRTLFQKYQGRVKKMFIYDPSQDWTWYLALMSGAQQDGIPVTEAIKEKLISEFGWKGRVEDFRNRWPNRIAAYDWALVHLMPHCSKQVVFALHMDKRLCDYVVATKGFDFSLDLGKPDERAEIEKIFRTKGYGLGTSLMGYAGDSANETANPFGIGYVVSDFYGNGSFWSSFSDKTYTQPPGKAIKAEPGKIYVSIMWSDGDNIAFDQHPLYNFWREPAHGTIPVATALSPTLQELNAPLLDWYYSKMTTNDELMCGPTGVQFIFVQDFNNELFPAWCRLTRVWCADAGFHDVRIWLAPYGGWKYITYMKTCGFTGVLGEMSVVQEGFPPKLDTDGVWSAEKLYKGLVSLKPNPLAPVFHSFTCIVQGFDTKQGGFAAIKREVDRVEAAYPGRYVFILPKDQLATMRACYEEDGSKIIGIGLPLTHGGLEAIPDGDGHFTVVQHEGRRCWLVPKLTTPNYFYVKVNKLFRPEPGTTLEIDLAYFDAGSGDISLDYDSTDVRAPFGGAYKTYPERVHRTNSRQWKLARFYVNDARFGHGENGGADFRFNNEGSDLLISGVEVQIATR